MTSRVSPAVSATITLVVFCVALLSHRVVALIPGYAETVHAWPDWLQWLLQPARWMVLVLAGSALAGVRPRGLARELGLAVAPVRVAAALGFALLCSTPMLILGLRCGVSDSAAPLDLLYTAAIWPLAEEILFRGYAFGLLVRRSGWNVWAAAAVTAAVFGAVHLLNEEVQVHELAGQLLSVGLIAAGGVVFAWLYYRWRFNLWVAVGLHGLMNLWYALFAMADTPIGSTWLIAARVAVAAIAVASTEVYQRTRSRSAD